MGAAIAPILEFAPLLIVGGTIVAQSGKPHYKCRRCGAPHGGLYGELCQFCHFKEFGGYECPGDYCIAAILKGPTTGSGMTEVHVLSKNSDYLAFSLQTLTGLHLTHGHGADWAFTSIGNGDKACICKGPINGSGKTEVHVLSRASNFQAFTLHASTALELTSGLGVDWNFVMEANGDLVAIKKGPVTGSGKTEVHVLSAASNYQTFVLHAATPLEYTSGHGANWDFVMKANGDLVGIKKGPTTGTGMTEVHILSKHSKYQCFTLQNRTGCHYTSGAGADWEFVMEAGDELMCINKGPSQSGNVEVHGLSASSNYEAFTVHSITPLAGTFGAGLQFVRA